MLNWLKGIGRHVVVDGGVFLRELVDAENTSLYLLEPDVKHGRGGLRDLDVAKARKTLADLPSMTF